MARLLITPFNHRDQFRNSPIRAPNLPLAQSPQHVLHTTLPASIRRLENLVEVHQRLGPPVFLVPNCIAIGQLTLLYGQPGCGKSVLALAVASAATAGGSALMHKFDRPARPSYVVYWDAENAPELLASRVSEMGINGDGIIYWPPAHRRFTGPPGPGGAAASPDCKQVCPEMLTALEEVFIHDCVIGL